MKVKDLIRIKRELTVKDDFNGECNCYFEGWIELTPKAKKYFKRVLNMDWRFNGSDIAIVTCKSRADVEDLVELFECIDGEPLTEDEWNDWFFEPEYERSWEDD